MRAEHMAEERRFSSAEIKLLDAVKAGELADYRLVHGASQCGESWTDERTISANTIRAILDSAIPGLYPTPAGMRIAGARITGELQLASLRVAYPVEFLECRIEGPINLNGA